MSDPVTPQAETSSGTWSPVFNQLPGGNYELSKGSLAIIAGAFLLMLLR